MPATEPEAVDGLPLGTLGLARDYGRTAAAWVDGGAPELSDSAPAHLLRPELLAAAAGVDPAPRSAPYRLNKGALCADVAASGDAEQFAALLDLCRAEGIADAESIAARAQSWRLPVLPFRRRPPAEVRASFPAPITASAQARASVRAPTETAAAQARASVRASLEGPADLVTREELRGLRVLDLSTMWAGPLATRLLADLGASVTRVTFPGRPDGLSRGPAADLFTALAAGKEEVALDLRAEADRQTFERLVADANVLVESFSRRVMPNLGYDESALRRLKPDLLVGTVRAFPAWRPERDWIGYGAGIHAALGLGELPDGDFSATVVSYPDPLAGLDLCGRMLAALAAGSHGGATRAAETSLYEAAEPLLAFAPNPRLTARPAPDALGVLTEPAPEPAVPA